MKKLVLIATILGALSSVPAQAETWVPVTEFQGKDFIAYIGRDSLAANPTSAPMKRVWFKAYVPATSEESMSYQQVDCETRMTLQLHKVEFKGGQQVSSMATPKATWQAAIPNSLAETLVKKVCST